MHAYEVCDEEPYLFPLASTKFEGAHQALSFLPKCECDVRQVEFAKAWRLTTSTVEPVSFTVPRVRVGFTCNGSNYRCYIQFAACDTFCSITVKHLFLCYLIFVKPPS